jgi:hypothetical protein
MDSTPGWIPFFFGSAMILMAALILGAVFGIVPTEGGEFLAPRIIVATLGFCLLFGGLAIGIPPRAPVLLRSTLFIAALASMAVVCNWTAFAPGVVYDSSTSLGPLEVSGRDQVGGRIMFGLAAIAVDLFIVSAIIGWARSRFGKRD